MKKNLFLIFVLLLICGISCAPPPEDEPEEERESRQEKTESIGEESEAEEDRKQEEASEANEANEKGEKGAGKSKGDGEGGGKEKEKGDGGEPGGDYPGASEQEVKEWISFQKTGHPDATEREIWSWAIKEARGHFTNGRLLFAELGTANTGVKLLKEDGKLKSYEVLGRCILTDVQNRKWLYSFELTLMTDGLFPIFMECKITQER